MPSLHLELKTVFSVFHSPISSSFTVSVCGILIPNSSKSDQMVVVAVGASCVLRYAGIVGLHAENRVFGSSIAE